MIFNCLKREREREKERGERKKEREPRIESEVKLNHKAIILQTFNSSRAFIIDKSQRILIIVYHKLLLYVTYYYIK